MNEQARPEVDPRELALIRRFQSSLEIAIEDGKRRRDRIGELERYVRGTQDQRDDYDPQATRDDAVRANLILGIIQTLVPLYYAKDPEIDVAPEEQVVDQSYAAMETFCTTLRIVLNRLFVRDGALKKRVTRAIPSAMTAGVAWLKLAYQRDYWQDPIILNRIADAQDNLARIQSLGENIDERQDSEAREAELAHQIEALQGQVEVLLEEGLVIDFVPDADILVLDESLTTFSEYPQARAIAHRIVMTVSDFEDRFGKKPTGAKYADKRQAKDNKSGGGKRDREQFVMVYEIWDRRAQTVYTIEFGAKEWAREPYRLERNGRRFYPFFAIFWNEVDGAFYPVPDVEQWTGLQDEYNAMRTQLADARREGRPGFVYRKGGTLTDEDLSNIANRPSGGLVGVTTSGVDTPLGNELVAYPAAKIDPVAYDATPVLRDIEQVSGASDASRASIQKAKTATEAEIQAQGMQSRTSFRQDMLEGYLTEMAEYAAQILLQELAEPMVERIAGPGYVWPTLPKDDIFDLIKVEIRAGSLGKPNRMQEREQWVQLAPQLISFMQQVLAFRQAGLNEQAEGVIELLRETLKRFDERIDIGKFFPPLPMLPQIPGMPGSVPPGVADQPAGVPAELPVGV